MRYCIERVKPFEMREGAPLWAIQLKNIHTLIPEGKNVILFNMERPVETMFYNDCIAYSLIPDLETIHDLQKKGFTILINDDSKLNKELFKHADNLIIKKLTGSTAEMR